MGLTTRTLKLKEGQKVFFISDTHYNHKNICRGTTAWDLKEHGGHNSVRDFDTVAKMNDAIVNDINAVVGQDDYLVCLGDWSFAGINSIWEFRSRIVCRNVILVLGNHDEHIDADKVLPNCNNYALWDPEKPDTPLIVYAGGVSAQRIFDGVYGRLSLSVHRADGKKTIYECNHFPWAVWDKAHHDRIHLYGHVHGNYTHANRALDVGIDNINKLKGNFQPLSEQEIAKYMKGREYLQLSHHNKIQTKNKFINLLKTITMRQANINGENVNFDLSGRSRDSYNDWGDKVSYLGEGEIRTNIRGEKTSNPNLTHFWNIN